MPAGRRYFAWNNRPTLFLGALATLTSACCWLNVAAGQGPPDKSTSNPSVDEAKPQPIPFSHKLHSQFIPDCVSCHTMPGNGWEISYPAEGKCMQCHSTNSANSPAIAKLADYYNEHKPVPWVKIYSLPDEVFFSHKRHYEKGKVDCAACHGPVREREVITKERGAWMEFCIDCHKERKAPSNCRSCHNR